MSIQEISPEWDSYKVGLEQSVISLLPEIRTEVQIMVAGTEAENKPKYILRGDIANEVSKILGYHLRLEGYIATEFENRRLEHDDFLSGTLSHAFIEIKDDLSDQKYVVDAGYSHFLSELGLPLSNSRFYEPDKEVLVFGFDEVDSITGRFVDIRNHKLGKSKDIYKAKTDLPILGLDDEKFAKYFANIWNIGAYTPVRTRLEDDIELYRQSPKSVKANTRRVIQRIDTVKSQKLN